MRLRRKANPRGSWSARCPLGFAATFLQDLLSCTTHGPVVQLSLPMPCAHHMQPNTSEGSVYCAPPLRFSKKATRGPWGPRGINNSELPPGVALCLSVLRGIRAHQQSSKETTRASSCHAVAAVLFSASRATTRTCRRRPTRSYQATASSTACAQRQRQHNASSDFGRSAEYAISSV